MALGRRCDVRKMCSGRVIGKVFAVRHFYQRNVQQTRITPRSRRCTVRCCNGQEQPGADGRDEDTKAKERILQQVGNFSSLRCRRR